MLVYMLGILDYNYRIYVPKSKAYLRAAFALKRDSQSTSFLHSVLYKEHIHFGLYQLSHIISSKFRVKLKLLSAPLSRANIGDTTSTSAFILPKWKEVDVAST